MLNEFIQFLSGVEIEFAMPWVWWLLPLPVAVYFFASGYRTHAESVSIANLSDLTVERSAEINSRAHTQKRAYMIIALIWLAVLATAARPERILLGEQREVPVRDILLVLDISGSMAIRDMQDDEGGKNEASRMQVMQKAVSEFIGKREHDNIGLIAFGSQALPVTPVSQDHGALLEQIDEMVPGMAGPQTSIGDAIGVAIRTFREAAQPAEEAENSEQERMMILLTDGLDTSSVLPPRVALRLAQKQNIIIHTIAFGDVHADDSSTSIDTQLLKDIAETTQGSFHQASESLASLQRVYDSIDKLAPRKVKQVGVTEREPLFVYPLALALMLSVLMLGWSLASKRNLKREEGQPDD